PVHLNLPFREPLVGQVRDLPEAIPIGFQSPPLVDVTDLIDLLAAPRGLIVAGNGVDDPRAVQELATATGWPIGADPLSGCQMLASTVVRFDAFLRQPEFAGAHRPTVVLQLGMPPASKVLAQWLAGSSAQHVAVSPVGLKSDPNLVGAWQIHASIGALCSRLLAAVIHS